jgi:hypothetical protein
MIVILKLSECKNHHFFALIRYFILIILLFPFKLEAQYRIDFETGSTGVENCCLEAGWRQVPGQRWCCDSIFPIEGNVSLRHSFDSSQEGCDFLVFRHDPLNIRDSFAYSFRIRHGFLPSNRNNWQLALGASFVDGADQLGGENLEPHIFNGLVLGVNYTGSDDLVKIWQVEEGAPRVLCSSTLNFQEQAGSNKAPLFRVEGDGEGKLELYWSPSPGQEALTQLVSCRIDGIGWGRELVLRYSYTSSRDRALWLDELVLEGHFEKDTSAPEVTGVSFTDTCSLQLDFSEHVVLSGTWTCFLYSDEFPWGMAPEGILSTGEGIKISFADKIPNRMRCRLLIGGVEDMDGNMMTDTTLHILRNEVVWGDVVFNEVMADPDPPVRQVEEYLELYNRSGFSVNYAGWQLRVNSRTYLLDDSVLPGNFRDGKSSEGNGPELEPGDFLLLTGITLPNDGALLSLCTHDGTLIHAATYCPPWDGPVWKQEGGWSLESPDCELPCLISYNWEYSSNPGGGTPGWANSNLTELEDLEAPVLLFAGLGDAGEIFLHFSETIQLFRDPASLRLNPGAAQADSILLLDPLREILYLHFPLDFREWKEFGIEIPGVSDCSENRSEKQVLQAGEPSEPVPGSVLINEIMYDPQEGSPEFVELFVPGPSILDLRDLAIHLVDKGGMPDHPVPLSSRSRMVMPGQYLVLTESVPHLRDTYGLEVSGQWVELRGMPGLNNSSGCIYLTDRAGRVVDMAAYEDALHMELLDDPRGISLERIASDLPGSDPDNWHSAASISAYATPGRENSQSRTVIDAEKHLEVSPEVFSPDNDGFEDLLHIRLNTGGKDWIIGIFITDIHGNRVRVLANNHLAAPLVSYSWDGEGEDGSMQALGFYVVHVRAYNAVTGEKWIRRKAVGLVYR